MEDKRIEALIEQVAELQERIEVLERRLNNLTVFDLHSTEE